MEKFKIWISTFAAVGGEHYYGYVRIPQHRQVAPYFQCNIELDRQPSDKIAAAALFRTIRFDTIQQIIDAAKEWFLTSPIVQPGDLLVISKEYYSNRDVRIEKDPYRR